MQVVWLADDRDGGLGEDRVSGDDAMESTTPRGDALQAGRGRRSSAHFSPIMIEGKLVLALTM